MNTIPDPCHEKKNFHMFCSPVFKTEIASR